MSNINSVMKELKAFILKGNIVDMVVGVTVGGVSSKIVASLANDILMPLLGALIGGASFDTLKYAIHPTTTIGGVEIEEAAILHGSFLQNMLDLLIIGVCMSFMIKAATAISNRLRREGDAREKTPAPTGLIQKELLVKIRDLLRERKDIA